MNDSIKIIYLFYQGDFEVLEGDPLITISQCLQKTNAHRTTDSINSERIKGATSFFSSQIASNIRRVKNIP